MLNRRVMRLPLFEKDDDYAAFERVLAESLGRPDAPRLLAYCLMPNHWHLVVQAAERTDLSTWMQWVSVTHTHRWHSHFDTMGDGPLYQGRFKSFPVQADEHFLSVCRYVEANALRASLVDRAEDWRWGSIWVRQNRGSEFAGWLRAWSRAGRARRPAEADSEGRRTDSERIRRFSESGTSAHLRKGRSGR